MVLIQIQGMGILRQIDLLLIGILNHLREFIIEFIILQKLETGVRTESWTPMGSERS